MKQYYKINSILHSGSQGVRGTPKTDEYNLPRVNRIIELNDEMRYGNIKEGFPIVARYVRDEKGKECTHMFGFQTTSVRDWDYIYDNVIRVETLNTIYEFEKVDL